mmetsp:Transcript_28292/g.61548  ORF Transcript_28292/g.61548 Transcript_28292/m.61548 type:complete len:202 (-) Transcript_28292:53-658(-)
MVVHLEHTAATHPAVMTPCWLWPATARSTDRCAAKGPQLGISQLFLGPCEGTSRVREGGASKVEDNAQRNHSGEVTNIALPPRPELQPRKRHRVKGMHLEGHEEQDTGGENWSKGTSKDAHEVVVHLPKVLLPLLPHCRKCLPASPPRRFRHSNASRGPCLDRGEVHHASQAAPESPSATAAGEGEARKALISLLLALPCQ